MISRWSHFSSFMIIDILKNESKKMSFYHEVLKGKRLSMNSLRKYGHVLMLDRSRIQPSTRQFLGIKLKLWRMIMIIVTMTKMIMNKKLIWWNCLSMTQWWSNCGKMNVSITLSWNNDLISNIGYTCDYVRFKMSVFPNFTIRWHSMK